MRRLQSKRSGRCHTTTYTLFLVETPTPAVPLHPGAGCSELMTAMATYPVFAVGEEHVPDDGDHVHVQHPVPLRHVGEV